LKSFAGYSVIDGSKSQRSIHYTRRIDAEYTNALATFSGKMSTSRRAWQMLESRVCAKLGGIRTPLSGSLSKHGTGADCINCKLLPEATYVEIKLRAKFAHHTLFKEVAAAAKAEQKMPVLITHVKNEKKELVILRMEDFVHMLEELEYEEGGGQGEIL